MRLLILGGTMFMGRHLTELAAQRGHELTLFNRGRNVGWLPKGVEQITGDRNTDDLQQLKGRRWDAVVDTSGYFPRQVRASAALLADAVEHYTFISSLSVYSEPTTPGSDEGAPVGTTDDPDASEITGENYGPLKVLCEQEAQGALPGRTLIVRPGLIVGPYDPTDRFSYWPYRVAQGGEVLAPGTPNQPVQFIDGRDLAAWTLQMAEAHTSGVYNADGPAERLSMGALLAACVEVSGSDAALTWVAEPFLLEAEVQPWSELPVWVPAEQAEGFATFSSAKAIDAGLRFRPLEATIRDTLGWLATRPLDHPWRAGITREREAALLQRWHARH